jgi:hypothetical protein
MDNGDGLSLLVPFHPGDEGRCEAWSWLSRYWQWALPCAEILTGRDEGIPFSKSCAVNEAAARAAGDVLVVMDADCYMDIGPILRAAAHVREHRSWWVPYRGMWRLTRAATKRVLGESPEGPVQLRLPPYPDDVQGGQEAWSWSLTARNQGAACQVIPALALRETGGFDPRFRGWGGEDSSHAMALDTLWAPRSYDSGANIAHLWHARIGEGTGPKGRMWAGQENPRAGSHLRARYAQCYGKPGAMRKLVDEGRAYDLRRRQEALPL